MNNNFYLSSDPECEHILGKNHPGACRYHKNSDDQ